MDLGQGPSLTPEQFAALPHDDSGSNLLVSIWILASLATIFLALRVYCKWFRNHTMWWDDYVLIAAWVCRGIPVSYCLGRWDGANTLTC